MVSLRLPLSVTACVLACAALVGAPGAAAGDLLELYARALEFDPRLQVARYQVQIAEESIRAGRSGHLPSLNANLQTTRVRQNIRDSDDPLFTEGITDFTNHDLSVTLSQPIYNPGTTHEIGQARTAVRQATYELAAAEQELIYRLAEAHFGFLAARDNLAFATAERTAIQRQLQASEERLAAGLATMTEVHEGRARFALAEAEEIDAVDILESARQAVAEITGVLPENLAPLSEALPLVEPEQPDVALWIEAAMFQNPTIKALEAQLEARQQDLRRQAGVARKPSVDLVATYVGSDNGGTEFGDGRQIATTNYGVRVNVPIFDGGRASAGIRSGRLQSRQLTERIELERREVETTTRQSFRGVMSGITRVEALRRSVFSQESALSQREEGLRAGLGTGLDVLDARRDLFSARRDLARARYTYVLSTLRLKQAAGILSGDDLRQIDAYLETPAGRGNGR